MDPRIYVAVKASLDMATDLQDQRRIRWDQARKATVLMFSHDSLLVTKLCRALPPTQDYGNSDKKVDVDG